MNEITRKKTTKKPSRQPAVKAAARPGAPRKVRVATMWLSGCSGCHMSFLDLDERLVELVKLVDIVRSPIVDVKEIPETAYNVSVLLTVTGAA